MMYSFRFHGQGLPLAVIILKNIFLTLCTCGIYSFWGRVRIRQYLWQQTECVGGRLDYHGTGWELFRGFIKGAGAVLTLQALIYLAGLAHIAAYVAMTVVVVLAFLYLVPFAIYHSQRYLLSRTSWRGVRFGMKADANLYIKDFILGYLLTIVTVGFYYPVWKNRLYRTRLNQSFLGNLSFRFTGDDGKAFWMFVKALPFIILTLGIYSFWYIAAIRAYRIKNTWIGSKDLGSANGSLNMSGGDVLRITLVNVFGVALTLGLALPWIMVYNSGFYLSCLTLDGEIRLEDLKGQASDGAPTGEGLADALDVSLL